MRTPFLTGRVGNSLMEAVILGTNLCAGLQPHYLLDVNYHTQAKRFLFLCVILHEHTFGKTAPQKQIQIFPLPFFFSFLVFFCPLCRIQPENIYTLTSFITTSLFLLSASKVDTRILFPHFHFPSHRLFALSFLLSRPSSFPFFPPPRKKISAARCVCLSMFFAKTRNLRRTKD